MNVSLHILQISGKGVQCSIAADTGEPFWLPRAAVKWAEIPEPGATVGADVPRWLALKHSQLLKLRGQFALPLTPEPGLDPAKANREGSFPMSDYPQDAGKGAIYRNSKAEKPSHPSHTGVCEIDGKRYRIAAWVKTSEKTGEKFFSLSFRPVEEQRQQPVQQTAPTARQPFTDSDIPFAPEVR